MSEEIAQLRDRASLLSEFQVIAAKHGFIVPYPDPNATVTVTYRIGEVYELLSELVQRVPKDAFSRSYLPDNVSLLIGEINEESALGIVQDLWDIHKDAPVGQPIQLIMSSCGGQVYAGLAIIGTINELRRLGREVHIHVLGWALSMAFDILQSASYRTMEPTAYLMTHEEQYGYEGSTSDQEQETKFSRAQETLMLERLAERTGRTVKYYRDKIAHKNWYIGPAEAISEGLIDEIKTVPAYRMTPAAPLPIRRRKGTPAKERETTLSTEESTHAPASTLEVGSQQEEKTATC